MDFRERQTWACILALLHMCDLGRVTLLVNVICKIEMTTQDFCEDFEQDVHNISTWLMLINLCLVGKLECLTLGNFSAI